MDLDRNALIAAALAAPFEGWDFSWVGARAFVDPIGWDYRGLVVDAMRDARTMIDMGTGGGEFVADLVDAPHRPPVMWATEAWGPNVAVAGRRLKPLGVGVVEVEGARDNITWTHQWDGRSGRLPFATGAIDLVINRHEAYAPDEIARVLAPGGRFITQQVGGSNDIDMFDAFGRPRPAAGWGLAEFVDQAESAGLHIVRSGEAFPGHRFSDVGALVYYLRAVPWVMDYGVDGPDVVAEREHFDRIQDAIDATGDPFTVTSHRLWLEATLAPSPSPSLDLRTCCRRKRVLASKTGS